MRVLSINNLVKNKIPTKNLSKILLLSSLLPLTTLNSCVKIDKFEKEELEQIDSTKLKSQDDNSGIDIIIDDSLNVKEHYFTI